MDTCRSQHLQKVLRLRVQHIGPILAGAHQVLTEELYKGSF